MEPIAPGLFEMADDGSITLVGGFSHISGHHHFPLGPVCPFTGADDVESVRAAPRRAPLGLDGRDPSRHPATRARSPTASASSSWTASACGS